MVGNGKPVGLIPDVLDQVQGRGHLVQEDAGMLPFLKDLFFPLGQANDGHVRNPQAPDYFQGGAQLALAPIDDDQAR